MYRKFIKRIIDFLLALVASPFIIIVICVIGPLIWLEDKGSIFYIAIRRGKNYKEFSMYKLRSMKMNAPKIKNKDGSTYCGENDERLTKIGKFIRKTSIDELPQVFNILKGDMSIIGPRPYLATTKVNLKDLPKDYQIRASVRPGLTGYEEAYYRNTKTVEETRALDVYYVEHLSFLLDLKILLRTIKTVFLRENVFNDQEK